MLRPILNNKEVIIGLFFFANKGNKIHLQEKKTEFHAGSFKPTLV